MDRDKNNTTSLADSTEAHAAHAQQQQHSQKCLPANRAWWLQKWVVEDVEEGGMGTRCSPQNLTRSNHAHFSLKLPHCCVIERKVASSGVWHIIHSICPHWLCHCTGTLKL